MFTFLKVDFTKAMLSRIANDNDAKTTVIGIIAAGILAAGVDWGKLFAGDSNEVGKVAGAVIAILFSYYTNKPSKK